MFADRYMFPVRVQDTFSADGTRVVARAEGGCRVEYVDVFNASNLATNATNYVTFKIINMGTDATGTTVIASASTSQTGGSAMTANVAFPLTVTTAAADVSDGQVIGFVYDESTTNVADNHVITCVVRYTQLGV